MTERSTPISETPIALVDTSRRNLSAIYPFAAVVASGAAKRALLLLAVEPGLRGVLIASVAGLAKSTLARGLQAILPANHFTISPAVSLPLNVTEDRLLGGSDLERTIATGKRQLSQGLLSRAHEGLLCIEEINLLDPNFCAHVAAALDSRVVRVEREGLSATCPAEFSLIGTYNPAEGEVSALLRDRVGLLVEEAMASSAQERAEVLNRVSRFEAAPIDFSKQYAAENDAMKKLIADARLLLPRVRVSKESARQIVSVAVALGIEGNRADIFAVKAARASAALAGRECVNDDDIIAAIQLVLAPRAKTFPASAESSKRDDRAPQPEQPEGKETSKDERAENERAESLDETTRGDAAAAIEGLIIRALDTQLPEEVFALNRQKSRRSTAGKRVMAIDYTRGRYARSVARRNRGAKIALDATLRAAALFQRSRRATAQLDFQMKASKRAAKSGVVDRHKRRAKIGSVKINSVKITSDDLRFKQFKRRSGMLFIFAVDASGSMAFNRMSQAKGAVTRLLERAYLHRDKVALVSFRGAKAEVLLPPTRSVELAKSALDALPVGGGTPLAAALVRGLEIARRARGRDKLQALLVILTDGRANVGLRADATADRGARDYAIREELKQIGAMLQIESIASIVIDTKSKFISTGEGRALADMLGGRYVYLPRADSVTIYEAVASAAESIVRS